MTSLRTRARRLAFGDSTDNLSDTSSTSSSSLRSKSSSSLVPGVLRHSSSISEQCNCGIQIHEKPQRGSLAAPRRTNRVRRIHKSQPFELFVEALEADGCVVVEDFVNPQISQRVHDASEAEIEHQIDEPQPQLTTVDVNALVRESLLSDNLYQTLSSHFLTLETISWQSKDIKLKGNKPRVSSSATKDLNCVDEKTTQNSALHRADSVHHTRHHASTKYDYQSRRETSLGLLVPELDSLSASIPVTTLPGSHLWDDQKPDISKGAKTIELRAGEALILLGSLYHQVHTTAKAEVTRLWLERQGSNAWSGLTTPKEKLMHEIWMCSGIYRPADEMEKESDDEA